MNTDIVYKLLIPQNINISKYLLKYKKELKISSDEVIFLSWIMNNGERIVFNIEKINNELYFDSNIIMLTIQSLIEKKLLEMKVIKNKDGIMNEYLDINLLYVKLVALIIDNKNSSEKENSSSKIYEVIEKEFGRMLSPIEYETIKNWIDSNIDESLIKEALKEAVLNGVNNLKYIDKILYEWSKKGYKTSGDVKKRANYKEEKVDLFDYDWLDDNE